MTLVELLAVLVIVGILAALVVPKFIGRDGFSQADAQTTLESVLERARSMAIVTGNKSYVSISASGVTWNQVSETWPSGASPNPASVTVTFSGYTGALSTSPFVSVVQFSSGQGVCLSPSGLSYACP
jgi:prepilin-type N-terminal cleavage/methylation domain-containing protein